MSHSKNVCQYGFTHGQCRCMAKDKTVKIVDCPTPNMHKPLDGEDTSTVDFLSEVKKGEELERSLHSRLDEIIQDRFWYFNDEARGQLIEELEEAVKDWLVSEAQKIRTDYDASIQRGGTTEGG